MVHGQQQAVVLLVEVQQGYPQQWSQIQVEGLCGLILQTATEDGQLCLIRHAGVLLAGQAERHLSKGNLLRFALNVFEASAQYRVPSDQGLEGFLQRQHIEPAAQVKSPSKIVGCRFWGQPLQKPQTLLGKGQGGRTGG